MIRLINQQDLNKINIIGLQIDSNFKKLYNMNEVIKQNYSKVYVYINESNEVLGFLHTEYHYEFSDIINIVVDEEHHHEHIGSKLLNYFINKTKSNRILLEVRKTNINAINLYNKFGFIEINRRLKYYSDGEDAIIMEKVIKNEK